MKKLVAFFGIVLAAAFARADVTSATEWQDVPPDMTLGAAAKGAGLATTNDCARAVAQEAKDRADALDAHTAATNNPHKVTAAQIGAYTTSEVDDKIKSLTTADIKNPAEFYDKGNSKPLVEQFVLTNNTTQMVIIPNKIITFSPDGKNLKTFTLPDRAGELVVDADLSEVAPDYAAVSNAAMTALQPAATNGLVTASVTNGLASAAALAAHASATNNPHNVTAAQIGALAAESDPAFAAWTNGKKIALGTNAVAKLAEDIAIGEGATARGDYCAGDHEWCAIAIGKGAMANTGQSIAIGHNATIERGDSSVALGGGASASDERSIALGGGASASGAGSIALGYSASASGAGSIALGYSAWAMNDHSFAIVATPNSFYLGSSTTNNGSTARTLQSYLDERATTNALAAVSNAIPVISATDATFSNAVNAAARALVKAKLESLDKAKSSIGETIAALQSIYETETK